ncbi:MAG: TRAP transporter permease [Alphaproteobacteria bacterium]|nr:TRAP transporter permease [Alphaproteobacteria bacterium]
MTTAIGYGRAIGWLIAATGAAMSLYHMWVIAFAPPEALIFRGTHLLFAMALTFLIYPFARKRGGEHPGLVDWAMLALSGVVIGYLFWNYRYIVDRIIYIDQLEPVDLVVGVLGVVLVLEATRRVIDWALPVTAIVFLAYCFIFTNVEFNRLVDQLWFTTEGVFGSTLGVSAGYVLIFVLFGSFMERTGTGRLFMDFALSLTGHSAGGPGKVSVVSSSLFGTISGSAVANVMVDGPITIPLMKRTGFSKHFAAGVEATASTGGQIMPPIMGAAAFVMAEFLGVSYFQVTLWALIPSLLYYGAVFAAVHFEAKRQGLLGVPKEECPRLGTVMRERGHLFLPVAVVLGMMIGGYSAPLAALLGTVSCFPVAMLRANTRAELKLYAVWDGLIDGARNALGVAMACACAGIVIGVIALTGLGDTFTQMMMKLAGSSLLLALLATAAAGIVLGMGMPTTPAYILMVALLVPTITRLMYGDATALDANLRAPAHMFAFYFAILSAITPPVALAVYAAAGLAKADLWKSGWAAVRIGAAGFIVPFMFIYEPAILMIGDWQTIVTSAATAFVGCVALAAGLHGYLLRPAPLWERAVLVVAAFCLIKPGLVTDLVGFGLLTAMLGWQFATRRRVQPA